jgi:UTP--glucose-1-phosphate uridylyltransferase
VGDEPFAVLLGDDIIDSPRPALRQMIDLYEEYRAPIIGIQRVSRDEVSHYGVVRGKRIKEGLYRVEDLVEKPSVEEAPSDLAVVGRYILFPEIFEILEKTKPGRNGEIQLTDGLRRLAREGPLYAYVLQGKRYDAGDKLGFLKATVEFGLKNEELGKEFREYLRGLRF